MNKVIENLKRVNTIFIFLFFCGASLVLLFMLGSTIFSASRPTGVQVTTEPSRANTNTQIEIEVAPRLVHGFYYFEIASPRVQKESSTDYRRESLYSPLREQNTINLFVIKSGEPNGKVLFPKNGLILQKHYAGEDLADGKILSKNVFVVVHADTNANGLLDDEDLGTIVITDYDGSNLQEIMTGTVSVTFPDSDIVLIKRTEGKSAAYLELNLKNGKLTELLNSSKLDIDAHSATVRRQF